MSSHQADADVADVDPPTGFAAIGRDPGAQLVDVRTRAEWSLVGIPDLGGFGKEPILIEWQTWPDMQVQPDFLDRLEKALSERGLDREAPLYFLCRSGVRSHAAARAAKAAGHANSYNISGGFEGPPDGNRHRGVTAGWKADGLPWIQS